MLLAVAGDDRDRPNADLADRAEGFADDDDVAGFDRTVHQQDQPGEKVAERFLRHVERGQPHDRMG